MKIVEYEGKKYEVVDTTNEHLILDDCARCGLKVEYCSGAPCGSGYLVAVPEEKELHVEAIEPKIVTYNGYKYELVPSELGDCCEHCHFLEHDCDYQPCEGGYLLRVSEEMEAKKIGPEENKTYIAIDGKLREFVYAKDDDCSCCDLQSINDCPGCYNGVWKMRKEAVSAPALSIGDKVKRFSSGTFKVIGFTDAGKVVVENLIGLVRVWDKDEVTKVTTVKRGKKASALIELFAKEGYEFHKNGSFYPITGDKVGFASGMFDHCGSTDLGDWCWEPEWLEEVEVEV